MGDAARPLFDPKEPIPAQWRELYAELAADWIRERGTLPPSLEALVEWSTEASDVPLAAEIAYLEGRGSDPSPCSSSD